MSMKEELKEQMAKEYAKTICIGYDKYITAKDAFIAGLNSYEAGGLIEYTYCRAYSDALLWVLENAPRRKEVMKKYEYYKGMMDSTIKKEE